MTIIKLRAWECRTAKPTLGHGFAGWWLNVKNKQMDIRLDTLLVESFPLLYQDRRTNPSQSNMCFGFECDDGWFLLIWNLSEKLEKLIREFKCSDDEKPRASQIKEKYGTLSFYMTVGTDEMFNLIEKAEDASATICEVCGKTGKLRGNSWVKCLCDDCDKN